MATITDLNGNSIGEADLTRFGLPEDSNINVYEFGNLILADLLPILATLINAAVDIFGESLTVTDKSGNQLSINDITTSEMADSNVNVYEFGNLLLAGTFSEVLWQVLDLRGSEVSASDMTGGLSIVTDDGVEFAVDSNINVYEIGNLILADVYPSLKMVINQVLDLVGTAGTLDDTDSSEVTLTDATMDNRISYDTGSIPYDSSDYQYDAVLNFFSVTDLSGS